MQYKCMIKCSTFNFTQSNAYALSRFLFTKLSHILFKALYFFVAQLAAGRAVVGRAVRDAWFGPVTRRTGFISPVTATFCSIFVITRIVSLLAPNNFPVLQLLQPERRLLRDCGRHERRRSV